MPAPTFVTEYETAWDTVTTPKTISVTVAAGDVLVVVGISEDASFVLNTPTGGGLTYTLRQSVVVTDFSTAYVWTAPAPSGQTFTLSMTMTGSGGWWGFNALRFSGSSGVGASSKTNTTGGPSLALTTTGANSAIVAGIGDWNAADGTSRTWRTVNGLTPTSGSGEATYFRDSVHYAAYAGYWSDAGAAGSKTVGVSAPSGQKYSIVAVEVLGTAGAAPKVSTLVDAFATQDNALWTYSGAAAVSGGQLQLVPTSGYANKIDSNAAYDLTSSGVYVQAVSAPQGSGTIDTYFKLYDSAGTGDEISILAENGLLIFDETVSGTPSSTSITYSPTTHAWWRIRHDGTNLLWETAPDGATWTTRRTKSPGRTWDSVSVQLQSGYFGTEPTPGVSIFDNLNVVTAAAALLITATLTAAASAPKSVAAALTATATLTAAATPTRVATASLPVTATLTSTGASTKPAGAVLSVTASLAAAAGGTKPATAALAATATFTAGAAISGAGLGAALAVTATLAAAATPTRTAAASLTATVTLSAGATTVKPVVAALAVNATLAAGATLSGSGANSALAITASVAAAAAPTRIATAATLAVIAALAADATTGKPAAAALFVSATLAADASIGTAPVQAAASLAVTASLTVAATRLAFATASLPVTATLTMAAARIQLAQAALAVTAALSASSPLVQQVAAALAVLATLTASAGAQGNVTPRPFIGTTARPSGGTTTRPFAGITPRP